MFSLLHPSCGTRDIDDASVKVYRDNIHIPLKNRVGALFVTGEIMTLFWDDDVSEEPAASIISVKIEARYLFETSLSIPGTHFCWRLSRSHGHSAAGRIMSMKNSNETITNRTRDLPACSPVPQPNVPPRTPLK